MSNMGLRDLRLVDPRYKGTFEAEKMAMGGREVLTSAQHSEGFEAALADCSVVVACTARPRKWKAWKALAPDETAELLAKHGAQQDSTALMFGTEDKGLDNEDLNWATHLCHIPTSAEVSSLNLSQAVLLLSWEWAQAHGRLSRRPIRNRPRGEADIGQINGLTAQMGELLDRISFFSGKNRTKGLATLRQALVRGDITETEVHFLRGVVRKLSWYVDHGPRLE
jgi:tRNA (cytidine32/uridine32-2'-O)-methyltransferase